MKPNKKFFHKVSAYVGSKYSIPEAISRIIRRQSRDTISIDG